MEIMGHFSFPVVDQKQNLKNKRNFLKSNNKDLWFILSNKALPNPIPVRQFPLKRLLR